MAGVVVVVVVLVVVVRHAIECVCPLHITRADSYMLIVRVQT